MPNICYFYPKMWNLNHVRKESSWNESCMTRTISQRAKTEYLYNFVSDLFVGENKSCLEKYAHITSPVIARHCVSTQSSLSKTDFYPFHSIYPIYTVVLSFVRSVRTQLVHFSSHSNPHPNPLPMERERNGGSIC